MQSIRTDLAKEAVAFDRKQDIEGINVVEFKVGEDIIVNRVEVKTKRSKGDRQKDRNLCYVECPELYDKDENLLAKSRTHVCGRSNKNERLFRYCKQYSSHRTGEPKRYARFAWTYCLRKGFCIPPHKKYLPNMIDSRVVEVSAIAPGVLGITGLETAEVIDGIVDRIKPEMIIVIDALASRSFSRIGTSIQVSDAGISPDPNRQQEKIN